MGIRRLLVAVALVVAAALGVTLVFDIDSDDADPVAELSAGTNPFVHDTDGDGLRDGFELAGETDPLVADTDGDGLTDGEEFDGGEIPREGHLSDINWYDSDPLDTDTDGDGIPDGREVEVGLDPTAADTDDDGLADLTEVDGPTDPVDPDTDGDNLLDGWEVAGETPKGADLPDADPLHKDIYVHVLYTPGVDEEMPRGVFDRTVRWFAEMPVENPDGTTGIDVRFSEHRAPDGLVDVTSRETLEDGYYNSFVAMRWFYNRETMGPQVGSHHLIVVPPEEYCAAACGQAVGSKVFKVPPWRPDSPMPDSERERAHTVTHELLHNLAGEVAGSDCDGRVHTCEGYLSYENDYYLSETTATKLNESGFRDPVYPEQMNATDCEETMNDPDRCGT